MAHTMDTGTVGELFETMGRRILIALEFKIEIYSFSKILTPKMWGVKISFGMDSP